MTRDLSLSRRQLKQYMLARPLQASDDQGHARHGRGQAQQDQALHRYRRPKRELQTAYGILQ